VRFSPKSVFIALVLLGAPFAVTIGWQLAAPAVKPAAEILPAPAGGAGGIGSAPVVPAAPATTMADRPSPNSVPTSVTAHSRSSSPRTPAASPSPSRAVTGSPVPSLTEPAAPTPTDVTTSPSAEPPSASADAQPAGLDPVRLLHKP
jgi:hypothetical protein